MVYKYQCIVLLRLSKSRQLEGILSLQSKIQKKIDYMFPGCIMKYTLLSPLKPLDLLMTEQMLTL